LDNLCFDCGLCCSGHIFPFVKVFDTDKQDENIQLYPGGCEHHKDMKCSIYEDRPFKCREYECAMKSYYDGGKITKEQALGVIEGVKNKTIKKAHFISGRVIRSMVIDNIIDTVNITGDKNG
jgi:hypothetical protein